MRRTKANKPEAQYVAWRLGWREARRMAQWAAIDGNTPRHFHTMLDQLVYDGCIPSRAAIGFLLHFMLD